VHYLTSKYAKNCASLWDSDPDAELTTLPILLAFPQLAVAASGLLCLQLPHLDVRVGLFACSPWLHGHQENFCRRWGKV